MWHPSLGRTHLQRMYISLLIILVVAVALGAFVGVSWRSEYAQCLAMPGGFQKILADACAAALP